MKEKEKKKYSETVIAIDTHCSKLTLHLSLIETNCVPNL